MPVSWIAADRGAGDDVLFGGDSEHYLGERRIGGGGRDERAGRDTVRYGTRTAAVAVDLAHLSMTSPRASSPLAVKGRSRPAGR